MFRAIQERATVGPVAAFERAGNADELSFEPVACHADHGISVAVHIYK